MMHDMTMTPPPALRPRDVAAARACLRCRTVFQSDGFGERICARCKASVIWRSGVSIGKGPSPRRAASRSA